MRLFDNGPAVWLPLLKGAPLAVLIALAAVGPLQARELETYTGYRKNAVTAALRVLELHDIVESRGRRRGWQLAMPAEQLAFEFGVLSATVEPVHKVVDKELVVRGEKRESDGLRRERMDSGKHHDHDYDDDEILKRLSTLKPNFDHAGRWLATQDRELVWMWLDYIEMEADRTRLENEAAFLHSRVKRGRRPAISKNMRAKCRECLSLYCVCDVMRR